MEYWVGRYQAVAAERSLEAWLRTLRRGEAAAATHWHDFGSSSAVVHESESATVDRQAGSGRSLEAEERP